MKLFFILTNKQRPGGGDSRLLAVHDEAEADVVGVVQGAVALPGQPDAVSRGDVGLELQGVAFTCRHTHTQAQAHRDTHTMSNIKKVRQTI